MILLKNERTTYSDASDITLPSNYDLRTRISFHADNQERLGICYAYATAKSIETNLKLQKNIAKDFSEIDIAVKSKQYFGGNFSIVYNDYLRHGQGPVVEVPNTLLNQFYLTSQRNSNTVANNIYNACLNDDTTLTTEQETAAINTLNSINAERNYYVMSNKNFTYINGDNKRNSSFTNRVKQNRDSIKKSIIENGSVWTYIASPLANTNYYDYGNTSVQYQSTDDLSLGSHAVSIIGWDDNFSRSIFPSSWNVSKDGAWLVLNSWGTNWGNGDGTWWISYEDYYVETFNSAITEVSQGKINLNNVNVNLKTTSYNFDGVSKTPLVDVIYNNTLYTKGTDYTVQYTNNVNPGTATVTITGIGRFEGTVTRTFTITSTDIPTLPMYLEKNSYIYDGTAKTPSVTVTDGSKTLTLNTDYTIEYNNNTNATTATIIGKGNYTGTITKQFTIKKADIEIEANNYEVTYDGKEHGIEINFPSELKDAVIKYGITQDEYNLQDMPTYINAGTYTIYYEINANNYNTFKGNTTIKINEKSINLATLTISEEKYTYSGTAKTPIVTVKDKDTTLIENTDYTLTYNNNINAGTATITITGKGNYKETASTTFDIEKGTPMYTTPSGLVAVHGSTLEKVKLSNGFSWQDDPNTKVGEIGLNTFTCTYTPEDTDNYNNVTEIEVTLKVTEKLTVTINKYDTQIAKNKNLIYINNISEDTTIEEIKNNIETNGTITIYESDGTEITEDTKTIKTGTKLKINTLAENIHYIFIVPGDNNGDGKFNAVDLLRLARFLTDIDKNLDGEYLQASDVYKDEKVNEADLLKMARVLSELDSFE